MEINLPGSTDDDRSIRWRRRWRRRVKYLNLKPDDYYNNTRVRRIGFYCRV